MTLDELPAWSGSGEETAAAGPERSSRRDRLVFVLVCAGVGLLVALPAAWLWSAVVDNPTGVVFEGDVFFNEVQLNAQSSVTMWFLVIGVVAGALAGLVVGWRGRRHGVVSVVAVLVLCSVAAWTAGYLGIHVFGPDESAEVSAADDGDTVSAALDVATWVAYLGWPIGGLVGALAAIAGWPREPQQPDQSDESVAA